METSETPKVVQLADQIVADIAVRGLQSGDAYLGTAEAARLLGVSTTSANRAMQLLVQRNVLHRRQKRGTFVAEGIQTNKPRELDRIHLVVNPSYLATEGMMADGVIVGIQSVLPGAEIEFNYLPGSDDSEWVAQLIARTAKSPQAAGFILARSSLTSQRLFQDSGLPTVIFGSRFPSIRALPSVDRDHVQVSQLLTAELLKQGATKLGVLMRSQVLPGDHSFLDALWEAAANAGLKPTDLTVRFLPADDAAIRATTRDLVHVNGVNGFICRSQPLAESAAKALKASKQPKTQEIPIVVADVYSRNQARLPWTSVRTIDSPEKIGARLAQILVDQAQAHSARQSVELLPVQLSHSSAPSW